MKIKNNKTKKPGIRLKVYVREDMVGGGKLELLLIVGETGSISSAAKKWGLIIKERGFFLILCKDVLKILYTSLVEVEEFLGVLF